MEMSHDDASLSSYPFCEVLCDRISYSSGLVSFSAIVATDLKWNAALSFNKAATT